MVIKYIPVWGGYHYLTFQRHYTILFIFSKIFWEYYELGPRVMNESCSKMTLCGMMHPIYLYNA